MTWRHLINSLTWGRVDFARCGDSDGPEPKGVRERVTSLADANVVNSQRLNFLTQEPSDHHALVIDIDRPAWLIESTTPGHSHLFVNLHCTAENYFAFLDAAAKIGLIEPGYAAASRERGFTSVRLPWVTKETALTPAQPLTFTDEAKAGESS